MSMKSVEDLLKIAIKHACIQPWSGSFGADALVRP